MSLRIALGLTALVGSAACAAIAPASPQVSPELAGGKAVYDKWCAPCHGDAPSLAGTMSLQAKYEDTLPAALARRKDLTPTAVSFFVRTGIAWMPPFRKTEISDNELAELGAYLSAPLDQRGLPLLPDAQKEAGQ